MHLLRHAGVFLFASLLLLPTLVVAGNVPGEFRPLGPFGGRTNAVVAESGPLGLVYTATQSGGVYVSTSGGDEWVSASNGLPPDIQTGAYAPIHGLSLDLDGRVYALTSRGAYASDNRGGSWSLLPANLDLRGPLWQILPDPANRNRLVASNGKLGRGVFLSQDRGQTWTRGNEGLVSVAVLDVVRAGGSSSVLYLATREGVYHTEDGGSTWARRSDLPGGTPRDLAVDPWTHDRLFLAAEDGVFRSEDRGATWKRVDSAVPEADIYSLVVNSRVLAMGRGGLYHMARDGMLAAGGEFPYTRGSGGVVLADGTVIAATEMGLFRGANAVFEGEGDLTYDNRGILNLDVNAICAAENSDVIYAATGQGVDAGVFRSEDNGANWEFRSMDLINPDIRSMAVSATDPDIVYVGTTDGTDDIGVNGMIFRSRDGGRTWDDVSQNLPHEESRIIISLAVDRTDPETVYAGVQARFGGIYKSTNGGQTWRRASAGLQSMPEMPGFEDNPFIDYFVMLCIAQDRVTTDRFYLGAGGCWGGVYISENSATSWVRKDQNAMEVDSEVPMPPMFGVHLELFDLDIDPSNPSRLMTSGGRGAFPGGVIDGNDQVGVVYESTDEGASWHLVRHVSKSDYFKSPVTGLAIDPLDGEIIYLAGLDGMQVSCEGGTPGSWEYMNEGLDQRNRFTRTVVMDTDDNARLYISTATSGVWVREVNPVAVELSHFNVEALENGVRLRWGVASAEDHAGFHVDRTTAGDRLRLTRGLLRGNDSYEFTDVGAVPGRSHRYHLIEVDRLGREVEVGIRDVFLPSRPGMVLGAARPNPSRGETRMSLSLEQAGPVRAQVFDARGRVVDTIIDRVLPVGTTEIAWDALAAGAAPGVYFIRVTSENAVASSKVMVLP